MYHKWKPHLGCEFEVFDNLGNKITASYSSFCREMLLGAIRYSLLDFYYFEIDAFGKNRIFIVHHPILENKLKSKPTLLKRKSRNIEIGILLFAGIISTAIFHHQRHYKRKVSNPIKVNLEGVDVLFIPPYMYTSIPIASLILGLIRIGYNIASVPENAKLLSEIKRRFNYDDLREIVINHDVEKARQIWNKFLKSFSTKNHIEILDDIEIQKIIDFLSNYGTERLFPITRANYFWRKQSEYYGIYNYAHRCNFFSRYDVRKILEVDANAK